MYVYLLLTNFKIVTAPDYSFVTGFSFLFFLLLVEFKREMQILATSHKKKKIPERKAKGVVKNRAFHMACCVVTVMGEAMVIGFCRMGMTRKKQQVCHFTSTFTSIKLKRETHPHENTYEKDKCNAGCSRVKHISSHKTIKESYGNLSRGLNPGIGLRMALILVITVPDHARLLEKACRHCLTLLITFKFLSTLNWLKIPIQEEPGRNRFIVINYCNSLYNIVNRPLSYKLATIKFLWRKRKRIFRAKLLSRGNSKEILQLLQQLLKSILV